jgi:molybdate transport system substrate-binding protein
MLVRYLLLAPLCLVSMITTATAQELRVLGAGSLKEVIAALGRRYAETTGATVVADFGPSGILRERIERGEHADLFASADMGHPLLLLRESRATRVAMFTRNTLCGVAVPKVGLTTANFLDRLLDPSVKLGTSTPKTDPAGDYTWTMFHRAENLRPGSYEALDKKAQQIVGGPTNNAPIEGKDPVIAALADGKVDVVIGYCTSAKLRLEQMPELQVATVPSDVATGPEYGLAVLKGADQRTFDLALFMLSPEGQQIFSDYGFAPIGLPAPRRSQAVSRWTAILRPSPALIPACLSAYL